ncbi:MAG: dockerin type I repeat-containing protein, partial [bacterium]
MNVSHSRLTLLTCLFCLSFLMILPFASAQPGDVNSDGSISLADAELVKDHILGLSVLTSDSLLRADANQNDKIDVGDLVYVFNNLSPQTR